MNTPALELRDVDLSFRGAPVLEGICLNLELGDFVALIGPNGGGKSVLLKVIVGLLKPDRGSVRVLGRTPGAARGRIAYVPQYAQFDSDYPIRVLDVVLTGRLGARQIFERYSASDRDRALAALDQTGMADLADRQIGTLSGGQLQRVLIARGLTVDAQLFLLDEPTASLDVRLVDAFYGHLSALSRDRTIVLVSHDMNIISQHVRSVACLNRRLHYHAAKEITRETIEQTYGCAIDFVTHRHTHRILTDHADRKASAP